MVLRGLSSSDSNGLFQPHLTWPYILSFMPCADHACTVARLASSAAASALYRNQKLLAQWRGSEINTKLAERVSALGEQCEGAIALQLLTHCTSEE